ncbi:photosynthetic reaction center cytochrome c subunit [Rhodobacterales bacterium HKCCE3408]|nr:photosynthetic reaction center cytochrome c subunit [Rhodobacterales bacterium HKCCE3408]
MLPKWFNDWNSANPTNIYGPAIVIGAAGGAVFVAAMLVAWGQPYATESLQTGPRGTGMERVEFVSTLAAGDPTVAGFEAIEPIVPRRGDPLAGDEYDVVPPALENVTAANYERLLTSMRAWTGIPDLLEDPDSYQTQVAYRMIEMTQNLNENWSAHVNANAEVGVTCYSCHRGQAVPNNIWFRVGDVNEAADGWPAIQNRVTMTSNFTSLPSTYLEQYLLANEDGSYTPIAVHDLSARVARQPGDPGIQNAEMTFGFMNYIDNSLGVGCTFCHNTRAFYDAGQVTPQWATAQLGIQMVQEMIAEYLIPVGELLPPERLGPVMADAPMAACRTCHQGQQRPLQGLNVIGMYPELATTSGDYDYSAFE